MTTEELTQAIFDALKQKEFSTVDEIMFAMGFRFGSGYTAVDIQVRKRLKSLRSSGLVACNSSVLPHRWSLLGGW